MIWAGAGIVVILALVFGFRNGQAKETAAVSFGTISQEVAATGKVKPNQIVSLGFDKSGRVAKVSVSVGEEVKKGQVLASLESDEVLADLNKARSSLQEANIKLREVKNTAPVSFGDASKNLDAAIKEGFASADNAVRNRIDQFFKSVPENPQFEISITSGNFIHYFNVPDDTRLQINGTRREVEEILNNWQLRLSGLDDSNLTRQADEAIEDLNYISAFLDKIAAAVNSFSPAEYAYETTVNNYKAAVSSARTEVSGAISSLVTAKDKVTAAPALSEGGQFESVLTQEAKVAQAASTVAALEATLGKFAITAPFDGVVTLQDAKVGGAVSAGSPLISLMSQTQMYVEANISEIHIGKVAVGNSVAITFDAFPGEQFLGAVSYVEPGDFIVDGVVNYKVRVEFSAPDPKIKSGLTTNLKIQTAKKEGVLTVPAYAVSKEGDKSFVMVLEEGKAQKREVNLGISGNTGLVEVLNGLNEGDIVEF